MSTRAEAGGHRMGNDEARRGVEEEQRILGSDSSAPAKED